MHYVSIPVQVTSVIIGKMKLKTAFFISIGILIILFLYFERTILAPFISAAIFAYLFNPVVNIISKKSRLPRGFGIAIIYSLLLTIIVSIGLLLSRRITVESIDITKVTNTIIESARLQVKSLPEWFRPLVFDSLITFKKSRFINVIESPSAFLIANQAISRVISFFIFLFSGFYFLKDGEAFVKRIVLLIPNKYRGDIGSFLIRINAVLSGYLRGQMLLIVIMSLVHFIALSIIGIKFALTLAIFSGFAEIVPVIGPITAGSISVIVALVAGNANFGLSPIQAALIVAGVYFIFRQLEDYLLIPHIMERITKLPPFFIFFAVIAGGHLAGMLGLILAVPIAAIIRLALEFSLGKVNAKKIS